MKLLIELVTRMIVLLVTAYVVPGFHIDSYTSLTQVCIGIYPSNPLLQHKKLQTGVRWVYTTALVVAIILGVLNILLKPLIVFFTLPATILSLGLFIFVINAILLLITSHFVKGFKIDSFFTAIIAAVVISVVSSILSTIIK